MPWAATGILVGDRPHPRGWGCFARILAVTCGNGICSPGRTPVRQMTGFAAQVMGLSDRGLLKPGWAADITISIRKRSWTPLLMKTRDNIPWGFRLSWSMANWSRIRGSTPGSGPAGPCVEDKSPNAVGNGRRAVPLSGDRKARDGTASVPYRSPPVA